MQIERTIVVKNVPLFYYEKHILFKDKYLNADITYVFELQKYPDKFMWVYTAGNLAIPNVMRTSRNFEKRKIQAKRLGRQILYIDIRKRKVFLYDPYWYIYIEFKEEDLK